MGTISNGHVGFVTGPAQFCFLLSAWSAAGVDPEGAKVVYSGPDIQSIFIPMRWVAVQFKVELVNLESLPEIESLGGLWVPAPTQSSKIVEALRPLIAAGARLYEYFDGWTNNYIQKDLLAVLERTDRAKLIYGAALPANHAEIFRDAEKYTPQFLSDIGPRCHKRETVFDDEHLRNIFKALPGELPAGLDSDRPVAIVCTSPIAERIGYYERDLMEDWQTRRELNVEREFRMWKAVLTRLKASDPDRQVMVNFHPRTPVPIRMRLTEFCKTNGFAIDVGHMVESFLGKFDDVTLVSPPSTACLTASRLFGIPVLQISPEQICQWVSSSYGEIDLGRLFPKLENSELIDLGAAPLKVRLLNDTRKYHCGSYAVCTAIENIVQQDHDLTTSDDADLWLFNGEGTVHHDRKTTRNFFNRVRIAHDKGIRVQIVNTLWQDVPKDLAPVIDQVEHITVREVLSRDDLKQNFGKDAEVYLDFSWFCPVEEKEANVNFVGGIVATDFYDSSVPAFVDFANPALTSFPIINMKKMDWPQLIANLKTASLLVTGRHHAVYAACKAEIPFACITGNSHKIEGLIATSGIEIPVARTEAELVELVEWAKANGDKYRELFEWMKAQPVWPGIRP